MSSFSTIHLNSKQAVTNLLTQAPFEVPKLQAAYDQYFPNEPLSVTRQSLTKAGSSRNAALEETLTTTLDAVDMVLTTMGTVERFIHLSIPKMEDGNNFGVTIQLQALKHINDSQEKLQKQLEELVKYYATRADAVEKCKLPSTSSTMTTTKVEANASGTDKEKGDTANSSTSQTVEQKKVESSSTASELVFRQDAVVAVDVLFYSKAKNLFSLALTSLLSALDFVQKNQEKIEAPRGKNTGTAYSSMY
ncbi:hypothetical protein MPSEU_000174200 [Mayamaea pseudoterrestris]|nr:hypothetical protein MPSEU_000174200 [Mayamaea pseudoterrestris]